MPVPSQFHVPLSLISSPICPIPVESTRDSAAPLSPGESIPVRSARTSMRPPSCESSYLDSCSSAAGLRFLVSARGTHLVLDAFKPRGVRLRARNHLGIRAPALAALHATQGPSEDVSPSHRGSPFMS